MDNSAFGFPFMAMAGTITVALLAVGGLERVFDDEGNAARAEKRSRAAAALFTNDRPVQVSFGAAAAAFSGGRTDVLTNGWGSTVSAPA